MKKIEDIEFNLNKEMIDYLIKFNQMKKELEKLYNLDKNDDILLKIMEKENELNSYRQQFIDSFRKSNQKEIKEYIDLRDKN